MKRIYGITGKEYDILLESQDMVCAICKKEETHKTNGKRIDMLSVDHNHETNEVRGLLCHRCNVGLGSFNDDLEVLEKAVKYLKCGLSEGSLTDGTNWLRRIFKLIILGK